MNIKYIRKRHNVYYYQRRVPEKLIHIFKVKAYLRTLETSDIHVAMKRAEDINAEWDSLINADNSSALYNKILQDTFNFPEHLEDLFSFGDEDDQQKVFDKLSPREQMSWRAAQEKLTGRPRDDKYKFSLKDGLKILAKSKKDTLPAKTWANYEKAIEMFGKVNDPLESIRRPQVALWIDSMVDKRSVNTVKTWIGIMGMIYEYAQTRGYMLDTLPNPFRNHSYRAPDVESYAFMEDDLLLSILDHLKPCDRLIPLVGRYHGMRLAEIFNSTVEDVEGIPCFNVVQAKTKAGVRIVPIRKFLLDDIRDQKPNWSNPSAYSKRFARAKRKVVGNVRRTSFHSLRVTFVTLAGRQGFPEQQVAWLVGHETGKGSTMSGKLYFKGYTVETLQNIVESIPTLQKHPLTVS
jgi:integrase